MKSIKERAQEKYPNGCGYIGSLQNAYIEGALDQQKIDYENNRTN